jgi:catechol 2,3-dioxygenase-like lactoylglutathione lyase family enzyme
MSIRGKDRQIDNIEFNVSDIARSKTFYGSVFGWTFTDYGPTYTEFHDGRITGGFTTGEPIRPGGPLVRGCTRPYERSQRILQIRSGQQIKKRRASDLRHICACGKATHQLALQRITAR